MYDRPQLPTFIVASGMATISTLVNVLLQQRKEKDKIWAKKDHYEIILPYDLYEETKEYFKFVDSSIKVVYVDLHDISKLEAVLSPNTLLVFLESLTNPMYEDYDVLSICRATHKYANAKVAVDNTLLTSYYYNPFHYGADFVVESLAKYTCGFGDVMAGMILGLDCKKLLALRGDVVSPFSCWLLQRSIPTLPIRMDRVTDSAIKVVDYLKAKTPNVRWYGKGGLITFSFEDSEVHKKIIENCQMIFNGYAFGYEETLILLNWSGYCVMKPPYESHIRLSVGLEAPKDIISDLDQAITKALEEN
jgi:cystathionine gamma-synthase